MDFKQAENNFEKLKAKFSIGALNVAEFKSQLEELMLQDNQGNWWMIGYETGRWYRHDGKDWVQTDPLGSLSHAPTQKPLKEDTSLKSHSQQSEYQTTLWKFGKKEIVQSSIGLIIVAVMYPLLAEINGLSRYWWSPALTVHLFFGLVFGPTVGAIVGAGRYIIPILIFYQSDYGGSAPFSIYLFDYGAFSSITFFSFVIEGFITGLARPLFKNFFSFHTFLRAELCIILVNLIRFLLSWELSRLPRLSPDSVIESLKIYLWYPIIGGLILVPIGMMIYSFILSRRKAKD